MTNRAKDHNNEQIVFSFLTSHLYSNSLFKEFYKAETKDEQLSGIDVTFKIKNTNYIVDEKAMTDYLLKPLPTFAFELDSIQGSKLVSGWFLDKSKKTTYYLLMWVYGKKYSLSSTNDIDKIEALLINREKLIEFLVSQGFNLSNIDKKIKWLRDRNIDGAFGKQKDNPYYYFLSLKKQEAPINVIVRKKHLDELAEYQFIITKDDLQIHYK